MDPTFSDNSEISQNFDANSESSRKSLSQFENPITSDDRSD